MIELRKENVLDLAKTQDLQMKMMLTSMMIFQQSKTGIDLTQILHMIPSVEEDKQRPWQS